MGKDRNSGCFVNGIAALQCKVAVLFLYCIWGIDIVAFLHIHFRKSVLILDAIQVKGCVITIDAMGTQTEIVEKIKQKRADYTLAVKG